MKRQSTTTLAEVVCISCMVGLLASMISPIVAGRRLTGDAAACLSNERRIGVALRAYADDFDGFFPPNRFNSTQGEWKDAVWTYVATDVTAAKTAFTCPGNFTAQKDGGDETLRWPRSYAYNSALEYGKMLQNPLSVNTPFRITDTKSPERYMLLLETRYNAPDLGPWMIDGIAAPDGSWSNPQVKYLDFNSATGKGQFHHHDKYMNVVMIDGHATSVTLPQTIAVPQMWSPYHGPDAYTDKLARMLDEYK